MLRPQATHTGAGRGRVTTGMHDLPEAPGGAGDGGVPRVRARVVNPGVTCVQTYRG